MQARTLTDELLEAVRVGTLSDIGPCYTRVPLGVFVSGRSAAWIARTVRVREVGSSNLPAPTIFSCLTRRLPRWLIGSVSMDLSAVESRLRGLIRDVPDFPTPGIVFKDITTLLKDGSAFRVAVGALCEPFREDRPQMLAAIESRGFPFGAAMALELECGLALMRKPGRLPAATERAHYDLEYGSDSLEIHCDALQPGQRVLVVDDLLATGGTARAAVELVERLEAEVLGISVLIELSFLEGRKQLDGTVVHSVLKY